MSKVSVNINATFIKLKIGLEIALLSKFQFIVQTKI